MKKIFFFFCTFFTINLIAQTNTQPNYDKYVSSLDSTIKTLYDVISGDAGENRNWELFKFLFKPESKLIPTGKDKNGNTVSKFMSPEDYIKSSGKWLEENGFHEVELSRKTDTFGHITQVFSTYESYRSKEAQNNKQPFMRGINSIQLFNDGKRWWILNVYWMQETEYFPIPKKYLQGT